MKNVELKEGRVAEQILDRMVRVIFPYPLTTKLSDKVEDSQQYGGWVVFLNNLGTLAHALRSGEEFLIRIPHLKLKGTTAVYQKSYFVSKLSKILYL